jgi:hypothetical protein
MPAGVIECDLLELAPGDLLNNILNGPHLGSENLDPGVMEHPDGPETHASGDDRFDLSSLEGRKLTRTSATLCRADSTMLPKV